MLITKVVFQVSEEIKRITTCDFIVDEETKTMYVLKYLNQEIILKKDELGKKIIVNGKGLSFIVSGYVEKESLTEYIDEIKKDIEEEIKKVVDTQSQVLKQLNNPDIVQNS